MFLSIENRLCLSITAYKYMSVCGCVCVRILTCQESVRERMGEKKQGVCVRVCEYLCVCVCYAWPWHICVCVILGSGICVCVYVGLWHMCVCLKLGSGICGCVCVCFMLGSGIWGVCWCFLVSAFVVLL